LRANTWVPLQSSSGYEKTREVCYPETVGERGPGNRIWTVTRTRTTVELVPSTEVRNRTKTFIEDNLPRLLYRTRRAANDILMNGLSLAQPGVLINGAVHRRLNLCSTDINNIELTDLSSRNIQTLELLSGAINVHDWEVSSLCFCDWVGCIRNWGARWVVVRRAPQLRTMNRQAPRLLTPAPARRTRRKRTQRLHRLLARPTSLEAPPRHPWRRRPGIPGGSL
jgi:hypothetical protein